VRYDIFHPGDKVITLVDYEGIPSGTTGTISTRWSGTAYVVVLPDGTFQWLNSNEFSSTDPSDPYKLEKGDIGVVTSDKHRHALVNVGDTFEVIKVVYDLDHYGVFFNGELKWFGGFQLG